MYRLSAALALTDDPSTFDHAEVLDTLVGPQSPTTFSPATPFKNLYSQGRHFRSTAGRSYGLTIDVHEVTPLSTLRPRWAKTGDVFLDAMEEFGDDESAAPSTEVTSYTSAVSMEWLRTVCVELFHSEEVAPTIVKILSSKREAEIQTGLFEIFGVEQVELIEKILKNRDRLLLNAYEEEERLRRGKVTGLGKQQFLSSITIVDERQLELKKKIRGLSKGLSRKRRQRLTSLHQFEEAREKERTLQLLQNELAQIERDQLRTEIAESGGGGSAVIEALQKFYPELDFSSARDLKARAIRRDDYTEFVVEPRERPENEVIELVPVKEFPRFARGAFKKWQKLNVIQSKTFPVAFGTSHNMLICAPTGCGKTNVAMMTVLRTIARHMDSETLDPSTIRRDDFKILYVTPMKALANEIVRKFSKRLSYLGIRVREYTGDMRLTRAQIQETQMIVTTPEKWDVVTRRQSDLALIDAVRLIIIDEIHLLNEDRGPVIECIVARTLQYIETAQRPVRLVGLSATLPNYEDVATFLQVNHMKGLFHFDNSFRPVPLVQRFIGVDRALESKVAYDKISEAILQGHQVMCFVHSRRGTVKTCREMLEMSRTENPGLFTNGLRRNISNEFRNRIRHCRDQELVELLENRLVFHHAGMLRKDRNLVEDLFREGQVRLLCCTSTLAWGVNLPAHTVIIKGTSIYSAESSSMVELGILDVMQIFGRAGRPQFDTSGEGIIITKLQQAPRYLALLNNAVPIESQLHTHLEDHLNAEVVRGSVTCVREAIRWLTYTYLYTRIRKNPTHYGVSFAQRQLDQNMALFRRQLIEETARELDRHKLVRYSPVSQTISSTHLGRTGSHYYIRYETMSMFNSQLKSHVRESDIVRLISHAKEFEQIKVRREDVGELEAMAADRSVCPFEIAETVDTPPGKVNVLFQAFVSRTMLRNFALMCDSAYIKDNAGRIVRAMLEIVLLKRDGRLVNELLMLNKCIERRSWGFESPLRQFRRLDDRVLRVFEGHNRRHHEYDVDELEEMDIRDIDTIVRSRGTGRLVKDMIRQIPFVDLSWYVQPITRQVLRVEVTIKAAFDWTQKSFHNETEHFWFFVMDQETEELYHQEYFSLSRKNANQERTIKCMIPIREDPPRQKLVRVVSATWFGSHVEETIDLSNMALPERFPRTTELLPLRPLRVADVIDPEYQHVYSFDYFNAIQTQVFHSVYHSDRNLLIGAATGCGKTAIADLAIIRSFIHTPNAKVVYIAPMKALVREKLAHWRKTYPDKVIVELTGDVTPDAHRLARSHIVVTTPEKWDGVTRHWHQRPYVQSVGTCIIDEVHLVGTERGAVLEVIVSRMRYVSWALKKPIRIVALGTSLANSGDASGWLGVSDDGVGNYNFKNSVRPVPLTTHIQGFSEKYYCPRMESMNKPVFQAICTHSPSQPVLVFVSSRRQTRLTALSLIAQCINQREPFRFSTMNELEIKRVQSELHDSNLRHTVQYGIGMHHAGLVRSDREVMECLFRDGQLNILVSTATLAWGVNLPAHLVVIKGTEYYDPKEKGFVQYPVTDILQMMGRAGRPQFDNTGIVSILVQNSHKDFYKKFLFEPFPVESTLHQCLHNHLNAEIASGVIGSRQEAIDYVTWTFLYRRLLRNPSYYNVILPDDDEEEGEYDNARPARSDANDDMPLDMKITKWLSERIEDVLEDLVDCGCIEYVDDEGGRREPGADRAIRSLMLGHVASFYYVDYCSVDNFSTKIGRLLRRGQAVTIKSLLQYVAESAEFDELPVRHNEDVLNHKLSQSVPYGSHSIDYESPHVKAFLLLQAQFTRTALPIADYITDSRTVLDQVVRIIHAYIDIAANRGFLDVSLNLMHISQMMHQGRWFHESSLLCLPNFGPAQVRSLRESTDVPGGVHSIAELVELNERQRERLLRSATSLQRREVATVCKFLSMLPRIRLEIVAIDDPNDEENLSFEIEVIRESPVHKFAHTPQFKKRKDEGFWLVVGVPSSNTLVALKRIRLKRRRKEVVTIARNQVTSACLYFMADSYIGLDQEYLLSSEVL